MHVYWVYVNVCVRWGWQWRSVVGFGPGVLAKGLVPHGAWGCSHRPQHPARLLSTPWVIMSKRKARLLQPEPLRCREGIGLLLSPVTLLPLKRAPLPLVLP